MDTHPRGERVTTTLTTTSSKDILIRIVGIYNVQTYEQVKRVSMQLAQALERAIIERAGGRLAIQGEGCDGITRHGKWEFCIQQNTKNHAGKQADEARCPNRCVQILGKPNPGWISAGQFLEMHGVPADELQSIIDRIANDLLVYEQQRLPV